MLIAGVIITVGLGFNWLVREHIKASEGLKQKAEAILKARSAYDTLIYIMLNGQISAKSILLSGVDNLTGLKTIPLNGDEISLADDIKVRIQDSNGLISLTSLQPAVLERLIGKSGQTENTAVAVESFLDWIDEDNLSRVNGAEEAYYKAQRQSYKPRNYAIQYPEEAAFIRGLDNGMYAKIEPYTTILPASGFNPNTASDKVLKAYLNISDETLATLKEYLSKHVLSSDVTLFFLTGRKLFTTGDQTNYFPSRLMEITVQVGSPRSIYTIKAGLSLTYNLRKPYSVIYWREE